MEIENYSIPLWLINNNIKNEKGELFEFKDHLFLFDILKDLSKNVVCKKCAQIGGTITFCLQSFHLADKRGLSTIYTMPSDSDVEEFSKTKADKIFQANQVIRGKIRLDNVGLKQIGNAFIYFKGTISKAAPISTTADNLVHDEIDRSDLSIIEQYSSRITASKFKRVVSLSNPSTTNVGIDVLWKLSDRKEWFITCRECRTEQFLTWESNVDEIRQIYVCVECGKEITDDERRLGKWKATSGGESSGYHISQMMAPWLSAKDLIQEKERRGIEYFRNFVLGEPYVIGSATDFRQIIMDNWTLDPLDAGALYMGIDVGKEKHWVLGSNKGIFKIGVCQSREELESVIKQYNPTIVMDSGPERTWAEEFRQNFPKLFLCFYLRDKNIMEMVQWGGEKGNFEDAKNWGYVWIQRNRVIEQLVYDMMAGKILFSLGRKDLERYIAHWETMRRVVEEVKALRSERYIWESTTGVNHWSSATWFYWLATQRGGNDVSIFSDKIPKKEIFEMTMEGEMRMRGLKEIMEENYDGRS